MGRHPGFLKRYAWFLILAALLATPFVLVLLGVDITGDCGL